MFDAGHRNRWHPETWRLGRVVTLTRHDVIPQIAGGLGGVDKGARKFTPKHTLLRASASDLGSLLAFYA
jgi:hypothetical protein